MRDASRACRGLVLSLVLAGGSWAGAEAPIAMEDAGGQALVLEALAVRLAAHGPLALVELDLTFKNPKDRVVEGRFTCTLPPAASLSRFAKEVDGRLMEGEVVERLKATQVYTEILHTMRDPALLEADQGNQFKARIFPIGPRESTRLLIGYSMAVPAGPDGRRRFVIPLRGLSKVGSFTLAGVCRPLPGETVVLEGWLGSYAKTLKGDEVLFSDARARQDFLPPDDLTVSLVASEGTPVAQALAAGGNQMVSFRIPPGTSGARSLEPDSWVVAADTSASRAATFALELQALGKILGGLDAVRAKASARLLAFDLTARPLAEAGPGSACSAPFVAALAARRAAGATDLAAALGALSAAVRADAGAKVAILVTDGIASLGPRDAAGLVAALGSWPATATLHVLVLGSTYDQEVCEALAEAGRGRVVRLPLTEGYEARIDEVVDGLRRAPGETFTLADQAAEWIEPAAFRDVSPGSELLAFARLRPGVPSRPVLRGREGGPVGLTAPPRDVPGFAPLLARETARAELAWLARQEGAAADPEARAKLRARRLEVSVGQRVVCPLTAMLVLESEADYVRYGIDRRALAEILEVTPLGIRTVDRPAPPTPPPPPPPPPRPRNGDKGKIQAATRGGDERMFLDEPRPDTEEERASTGSERSSEDSGPPAPGASARRDETDDAPSAAPARGPAPAPPPPEPVAPRDVARRDLAPDGFRESILAEDPRPGSGERGWAPSTGTSGRAGKAAAPSWTEDGHRVPKAAELAALRAAVGRDPRDRTLRNSLAWALLRTGAFGELETEAWAWQPFDPVNPMVYEFLSESFRGRDLEEDAARALSSIAEVSPTDSGLLNRAGYLALRAERPRLAEGLFRTAIERRPDHANNYRGLALALWSQGDHAGAAAVLEGALTRSFNPRYGDLARVLREELGMVLAAWIQASPGERGRAETIAKARAIDLRPAEALRITLHWETDANDVDLHVVDPAGEECFYSNKRNLSGLELYEDLTQGLGPEVAVVPAGKKLPGAYHVGVKYFAAGPMGVSRGVVVVHRPTPDGRPRGSIHAFTLLPDTGAQDMRHLAVIE